ncbi:hypothetical protein DCD74_02200 [Lysobacter oculi]|uniref:DUF4345 domain-containing protein n=1 Tax=Solilutibacter oculi TaxID=2698682 RepID=A0A344J3P6_9GAMM|nr:hypothetical protein [Lysobacter oculi]AXA83656.1 hypothetical protein DCD74_02200 [Lysobacter oculi]
MSLVKIIAAFYVLFGTFGLLVVSVPTNYGGMFHEPGRPAVGLARLAHAYVTLIFVVVCGASAWLFPGYTAFLAVCVLAFVLLGKLLSVITGRKAKCLSCFIGGTAVAIMLTWTLVAASSQAGTG